MENDAPVIVVACDESGNDRENLFGGNSTIFDHGSTSLSTEDADELIAELRFRTKTQSAELKSKDLLKETSLDSALWMLRHPAVAGRSLVHLTENRYFLTCKLFDSTVEEQLNASGIDIYANNQALRAARFLYAHAPHSLGEQWDKTLGMYNRLIRCNDEADIQSRLAILRTQLVRLGPLCSGTLNDLLGMIWGGTAHLPALARQQAGLDGEEKLRTLDPVICAVGQTAHSWGERSGSDVAVVHDEAKVLTPATISSTT